MKTSPSTAKKPRKFMIGLLGLALIGGIVATGISYYLENAGKGYWVSFLDILPKPGPAKTDGAASIQAYSDRLRAADPTGSLVVKVEPGITERTVNVVVTSAWSSQPQAVRQQAAQNLWKGWASIVAPSDLDKAYIKIVDVNGNRLGGSGWAGSMVNVD